MNPQNQTNDKITATQVDLELCIQKVATGPEYSKNLSFDEARAAMDFILSGSADPVQAAVALVALRMKRETDDENLGVMQAIIDHCTSATSEADQVLCITDPFNGQLRGLPMAPFVAPVLAACGLPTYSLGVESVGPKFGITHRNVLAAAGVKIDHSTEQLVTRLADHSIGWGYLDQSQYCPALHRLVPLRNLMIKRTLLTTLEVVNKPVSGKRKTHLLTGYVHQAYPPVYAEIARFAGYDSAAIVRGVEGGVLPSLRQPMRFYQFQSNREDKFFELDPVSLGIEQTRRAVPLPGDAKTLQAADRQTITNAIDQSANLGVAALQNQPGITLDSIVYGSAIALYHLEFEATLKLAADRVRRSIAAGDAFDTFSANLA